MATLAPTSAPTGSLGLAIPKYGDTVVDSMGRSGTAKFDPNTGLALKSPTVMTDSNVREKVIPNVMSKSDAVLGSSTPTATQPSTSPASSKPEDFATMYKAIYGSDPSTAVQDDPQYASEMALINSMQKSNDAEYNSTVQGIRDKYVGMTEDLKANLQSSTNGVQQSLLNAGTEGGGQGGSSRYAPISSSGILDAKARYNIKTMSDLATEEQQLITQAQSAKTAKDYQNLQKQLDLVDKKRTQKNDLAKSILDNMVAESKKNNEATYQSSRDTDVSNVVSQGITDPSEILSMLNHRESGTTNFTADEVAKALKNLSPDGDLSKLSANVRDYYILKQNNSLPASILAQPEDKQLGSWLQYQKVNSTIQKPPTVVSTKPVVSGTLTISPQDLADGHKRLQASEGPDGYVDPAKYQEMYTGWLKLGGIPQDFIKHYPPKDYVNPANTTLPAYLRSSTAKAAAGRTI